MLWGYPLRDIIHMPSLAEVLDEFFVGYGVMKEFWKMLMAPYCKEGS